MFEKSLPQAIKIRDLPSGFYTCLQAHPIKTKYGSSNILNLEDKKSGEFISVFANGMLNGYVDKHPDEIFTFLCDGQHSFSKDGKNIEYTKIQHFTRVQEPNITM